MKIADNIRKIQYKKQVRKKINIKIQKSVKKLQGV